MKADKVLLDGRIITVDRGDAVEQALALIGALFDWMWSLTVGESLARILPEDLSLYRTNVGLVFVVDEGVDQVTVQGYFAAHDAQVERVELDAGAGPVWTAADIAARVQVGEADTLTTGLPLSGGPARELLRAIATGDVKRFQAVPGIGKRTAERIIVELREKYNVLPDIEADPEQMQKQMELMGKLMASISELDVSMKITVPGEIVESNAPTVEGNTSIWQWTSPGSLDTS